MEEVEDCSKNAESGTKFQEVLLQLSLHLGQVCPGAPRSRSFSTSDDLASSASSCQPNHEAGPRKHEPVGISTARCKKCSGKKLL